MPTIEKQPSSSPAEVKAPLYAYGIVRPGARAPVTRGVLDAPVLVVESGSVAALTSSLTRSRASAGPIFATSTSFIAPDTLWKQPAPTSRRLGNGDCSK